MTEDSLTNTIIMKDIILSKESSAEKVIVYLIREELKSRKFFEGMVERLEQNECEGIFSDLKYDFL